MISDELKQVLGSITADGKMDFRDGATEGQIEMFEKENGIALPSKYKEWLKISDGGYFFLPAGVQMYGVSHKPLIDVDDNDRPDGSYVVIGALSTGDPILFKNGSEQISIYNHGDGIIEDDETYADYTAFLKDLYDLLGIGE